MKKIYLYILLFFACVNASAQVKPVIAVLGDSYSTFQDFVEPSDNVVWYFPGQQKATDVTDVRETWWQILAREGGYRIGKNNSYSGSTVCRTGYREEDYTDRAFITRMTDLGDPDILLIFGATNDSWAKVPIGEYVYSNWKPMQLYSFRPAMARCCGGSPTVIPMWTSASYSIRNSASLSTRVSARSARITECPS